ncbi:hypothetical protein BLJAPNOD_06335 [Ensifer sp. M14]|uniref:hypothetical protein n=1 Tax=Ensifer sp. M14 TaxID=2203782 RepID=UPI000E2C780D|nr:hypothetical protein [Ensifer sp. M14]RDL46817.1 hypothetical protein BLJAPNOD_06335 [Ensifer sp. M14]
MRAYHDDADRKRILIRRAEAAKARLAFVTEAMRRLISDSEFKGVLEEEGLISLPETLATRLTAERGRQNERP